jgi:hypothetical protein
MRVALFTCFSPDTGGGAVILRTVIAQLPEFEVTWFHLGPPAKGYSRSVSLGPRLIGGSLLSDLTRTPHLWLRGGRRVEELASHIVAGHFDRHWVVAMDEGVRVGLQLAAQAPTVPLHVSVHDDQEHGMYGRSRRYRFVAPLVRAPVRCLLRTATSIDVASDEMADYYQSSLGVKAIAVHPVVSRPSSTTEPVRVARDPASLTVGHIGAIYSPREFTVALDAVSTAAKHLGRKPRGIFVGLLPRYRSLVERAGIAADMPDHLDEEVAVEKLRQADFVYAMYPFDPASRVFVRTSLPTKLSTYVRVGRPILAHTPAESTLARVVHRFGVGRVCSTNATAPLARAMIETATSIPSPDAFAAMHLAFYGPDNAVRMSRLLKASSAP